MRPTKIENYMAIADIVAQRSHDAETKVGAVLVNDKSGAIVATGYNGFVRGACDEKLPCTRPDKYEFILHAEQNLIANCARHGISMEDCTLICTMSPCKLCMRLMINCGITKVVTRELYRDFQEILDMPDVRTRMSTRADGLHEITYSVADNNDSVSKRLPDRVEPNR
jgi:dCMP deaminase